MLGRSLALGVLLGLLLASVPATAQSGLEDVSEQDKEAARALVKSGDGKIKAGDFAGALRDYRAATVLVRVPTTSLEMGKTLEVMGRLLEARQIYREIVAYPQAEDEPAPFTQSRNRAAELLRALDKAIPQVTIELQGVGAGVQPVVLLNGKQVQPGQPLDIDPGEHTAEASAPDHQPASRRVTLHKGEAHTVVLTLQPSPAVSTPPAEPALPPSLQPMPAAPDAGPGVLDWLPPTLLALGGAGLLAGGITGGLSIHKGASFEEQRRADGTYPESARPLQQETLTLAHVSTASFIVGGVSAAAGLVLLLVDDDDDEPQVGLTVSTSSVTLRGSF